VVVLAGSAGGIAALSTVLGGLPDRLHAAVVVVQHRVPDSDVLVRVLAARSALPVVPADRGLVVEPGLVYVCPAHGQTVVDGHAAFRRTDAETTCRADPLLRSCATTFGPRCLAIVLSGRLDDGASGVVAVKARGGMTIAQDRASSEQFGMPSAAILSGCVDLVLPVAAIPTAIGALVGVHGAADLFRGRPAAWAPLVGA
jgi:two-component system chemotaxis response regulator CheB